MLLWLWHTTTVYWATAWPLHARRFNKSKMQMGCYHFISCIVIAALSAVPVVIVMLVSSTPSGRGGFIITHAPPILCTGFDIHTNFWAFVFPTSLVLAVGVTFVVFTLRVVIKVAHRVVRNKVVLLSFSSRNIFRITAFTKLEQVWNGAWDLKCSLCWVTTLFLG